MSVAVAWPADGAGLHSGLSLCFVSSADVTSPVGRFGGGGSRSWTILWARWSLSCAEVPFFLDVEGMEFLILPPTLRAFLLVASLDEQFFSETRHGFMAKCQYLKAKICWRHGNRRAKPYHTLEKNVGFAGLRSN